MVCVFLEQTFNIHSEPWSVQGSGIPSEEAQSVLPLQSSVEEAAGSHQCGLPDQAGMWGIRG